MDEIVVTEGDTGPVLVRGPSAIAVIERDTDAVRASAAGRYGGIGLVTGVALVVVVMRALLAQAVDRDAEARVLQTELDGVI